MDQRELVDRARRGDHDAFAALAGASVARLDAAARLILRDHELARDAVQEGFIRAWKSLPALRDPDRFEAWLRRLVVRSCFDTLRRRGRSPVEVELSPFDSPAVADETSLIADREVLDVALRRLTPGLRAVVVLHYYLGLTLPEVAASLGIPTGTAKSRLNRSLAAMRASIAVENIPDRAPVPGGQLA
ncbi:MAG: RNA polymerase sigma factor [Chloroflexota bacterium]